jgi:hypothetical protein
MPPAASISITYCVLFFPQTNISAAILLANLDKPPPPLNMSMFFLCNFLPINSSLSLSDTAPVEDSGSYEAASIPLDSHIHHEFLRHKYTWGASAQWSEIPQVPLDDDDDDDDDE